MHSHIAQGQWAVQLLQRTASVPGASGQCNSCNALPHRLGAVGRGTPFMHCLNAWWRWAMELLSCTATLPGGSGQCNSCYALPHCLGAVESATPAKHRLTAWGDWAVELLQCTATPPGGDGWWNSCYARAHQLSRRGVLPERRSLPTERNSYNAPPHCLGAVGSASPAMHCHTAWGRWAMELLLCAGPPARETGSPAQEAVVA